MKAPARSRGGAFIGAVGDLLLADGIALLVSTLDHGRGGSGSSPAIQGHAARVVATTRSSTR